MIAIYYQHRDLSLNIYNEQKGEWERTRGLSFFEFFESDYMYEFITRALQAENKDEIIEALVCGLEPQCNPKEADYKIIHESPEGSVTLYHKRIKKEQRIKKKSNQISLFEA